MSLPEHFDAAPIEKDATGTTVADSENFSDKRKRGRPTKWEAAYRREVLGVLGRAGTVRGQRNHLAALDAVRVLLVASGGDGFPPDGPFAWLICDGRAARPQRITLLAALGRIGVPLTIVTIALMLCEYRPTTADGLILIQIWREDLAAARDMTGGRR